MRVPLFVLAAACLHAQSDLPGWVREAAAQKAPTYPPKVTAVVLLQEEHLAVDAAGRRTMRERGAVRILQQSRGSIAAYRSYNSKNGRIRDFQGWVVAPDGKAAAIPKNKVVDRALSTDSTYTEYRARSLDPGNSVGPGGVFAWEIVEEERTVFTQYPYAFQSSLPVMVSRLIVTAPAGWEVKGVPIGAPGLEPSVAGSTYTWEMRGLPWIEREDYAPGTQALAPRLGVTYFAPEGAGMPALDGWGAVSGWLSGFVDPPAGVTPAIRDKAAEITAKARTELNKIRAIAAYVQKTNYVSVQMNLTRGGGYTPNPAEQVLARNYGDCKDKSTLMRALLAAAGIESYATVIYWGERSYVRPEWPSPHPFNHMILAVRVSENTELPTVIDHPRLGRLLPFDPTDPFTPLGDLPSDQQGSHALIVAGAKGELVVMPLLEPAASRIESVTEAAYDADGSLTAKAVRQYFGQRAARLRGSSRSQGKDEFKKSFEAGLSRRLGGLSLGRVEPTDYMDEGRLQLDIEMSVGQFGQLMQGRMLVLAPGALVPIADYGFTAAERKTPVELMGSARKDLVTIALPAAFRMDELPDAVSIETGFAAYKANWSFREGALSFSHELEVRDALIPAARYAEVRRFFESVASAQTSAAVLIRQ